MCGIAGIVDPKNSVSKEDIQKMIQPLSYRGPDDEGITIRQASKVAIGLGHKRLSIIDLSVGGHQPKSFQHLDIVLNGEIYNYIEIRKLLISQGYTFDSDSDTEVVLKSFHCWGEACVTKFIGMFAICIFDSKAEKLYLCRDRLGVKPLYYYHKNNVFLFASELKALISAPQFNTHVNLSVVPTFIQYGYIPGSNSIYESTYKLEPGSWGILDCKSHQFNTYKYWDLIHVFDQKTSNVSYSDALDYTETIITSSCELRMVADVPIGIFLSGGYDSTLVTSILANKGYKDLKTFTIGFPGGIDESQDAKKIAAHLGTQHTSMDCSIDEVKKILIDLPLIFDEPCGDISCIPTIMVSRLAAKNVKVALSADGGDESFAGYNGYFNTINRMEKINSIPSIFNPFIQIASKLINNSNFGSDVLAHKLKGLATFQTNPNIHQFILDSSKVPDRSIKKLMQNNNILSLFDKIDNIEDKGNNILLSHFKTSLPDYLLVKVDRATMSASIEAREPLLDHRLVEFAATLPFKYKNDGRTSKRILKDIVHKYVPKAIMDRPKTGFDLPIFKWLKGDMSWMIDQYLGSDAIKNSGIFNANEVNKLVASFRQDRLVYKSIIWHLIVFQMWHSFWNKN